MLRCLNRYGPVDKVVFKVAIVVGVIGGHDGVVGVVDVVIIKLDVVEVVRIGFIEEALDEILDKTGPIAMNRAQDEEGRAEQG